MNSGQWAELLRATKGHTPGPWEVRNVNSTPCVFCTLRAKNLLIEGWGGETDIHLAAAAPDLLAEVERLRGWLMCMLGFPFGGPLILQSWVNSALKGAEVPK